MIFFKVLYFKYYQLYTKVMPDDQPNATVIFVISFIESLLLSALIDYFLLEFYCKGITKVYMIGIMVTLLVVNYFYYYRSGRYKSIIKEGDIAFGNSVAWRFVVLFFSLVAVSWMFWGPVYGKLILDNCI